MTTDMTYKLLLKLWLQQVSLLLLAVFSLWWINPVIAYSVLIGGIVYIVPNMYFALYAFRYRGAQAARHVLLGFYRGEVGKFLLTGVGFAVSFTLVKPLSVVAFLGAYCVLVITQWVQLAKM